jgi:tetratricopeptide (TPR) repeat protein
LLVGSLVALLGAIVLVARRRAEIRLVGLWFFLALLPVAEVIPLGVRQNDLLLYLPLVGLVLLMAMAVRSKPALIAGMVVLVACAITSAIRVKTWSDSLTLWTSAVEADPSSPSMRVNYANALRESGQIEAGCAQLGAVLDLVDKQPNRDAEVRATYNLGNCAREAGDLEAARSLYMRAFQLSGETLGPAIHNAAKTLIDLKRYDDAVAAAQTLVALDTQLAPSWKLLGVAYIRAGHARAAAEALDRAIMLDPDDVEARSLRAELRP